MPPCLFLNPVKKMNLCSQYILFIILGNPEMVAMLTLTIDFNSFSNRIFLFMNSVHQFLTEGQCH